VEQTSGIRTAESPSAPPFRDCARVGGATALSFAARKQRQLLFLLTRQLAEAQFVRADKDRTQRLWQEAAALDLDPDRIIHLLYGVADHADSAEMDAMDRRWRPSPTPQRRGWWVSGLDRLMGKSGGVWHQSAPPAATPARR
jgi:hypothetical protein